MNCYFTKEELQTLLYNKEEVEVFEEINSTSTYIKEIAEIGKKQDHVVVAFSQTQGRGRRGKQFSSPKNGIYFSFLLNPNINPDKAVLLTIVAAISVNEAIKEEFSIDTKIKWVNDIYKEDKKVCGILVETPLDSDNKIKYAICGIGINIVKPKEGYSEEIKDIAGSLFEDESQVSKEKLLGLVSKIINKYNEYYNNSDKYDIYKKYTSKSLLIGKKIKVLANEPYEATVIGINKNYGLEIVDCNKKKIELTSGEVSIKPSF